jgi:hypothetical protein
MDAYVSYESYKLHLMKKKQDHFAANALCISPGCVMVGNLATTAVMLGTHRIE